MWEIYVEPNLKAQEELRKMHPSTNTFADDDEPMTLDQKVVQAQAMGIMFGHDPLEVGKAVRNSWPPTKEDIESIREKLRAREKGEK